MGPLIDIAGKAILGNLWSTTIGGSLIWTNLEPVIHILSSGVTVGSLLQAPQFQALASGVAALIVKDPSKLPQAFFKN
jgi:hypothetical protein